MNPPGRPEGSSGASPPLLLPLCSELGVVTTETTEELGPSLLPPIPCGLGGRSGGGQDQWSDTTGRLVWPNISISWDCSNQIRGWAQDLNSRQTSLLTVPEVENVQIKVPAVQVLVRTPLLACRWQPSLCVLTRV